MSEQELRREFERLFEAFEGIDSTEALYEFQIGLADAICRAEPPTFRDKSSPERDHLRRLRQLGDGLAWRLLHPYAIRQLAKNSGSAPSLSNQTGFAATMEMAREQAEQGAPVIVSDLTNCLRVGDVAVCVDAERPLVLESGGHPRWLAKGRKGRQRRRALAISKLLQEGQATLEGDSLATLTITVDKPAHYPWSPVEEAVGGALKEGRGVAVQGSGDVVLAVSAEEASNLDFPEFRDVVDGFVMPVVGMVTVLERPNPRAHAIAAWPISARARLAVLQSDVFVLHAVDAQQFCGEGEHGGRVTGIQTERSAVIGLTAEVAGATHHLSPFFLDEVVSGFQTIASTRELMIALARAAIEAEPELEPEFGLTEPPRPVASVHSVHSIEEAIALAEDPEALRQYGYVSMPLEIIDELRRRTDADDD